MFFLRLKSKNAFGMFNGNPDSKLLTTDVSDGTTKQGDLESARVELNFDWNSTRHRQDQSFERRRKLETGKFLSSPFLKQGQDDTSHGLNLKGQLEREEHILCEIFFQYHSLIPDDPDDVLFFSYVMTACWIFGWIIDLVAFSKSEEKKNGAFQLVISRIKRMPAVLGARIVYFFFGFLVGLFHKDKTQVIKKIEDPERLLKYNTNPYSADKKREISRGY
eukprot:GHVP01069149.1.p1 GENE.GHVP01069149.1~~GHVP01069149.1.p1  ORF type:complete len:220 (-),score=31.87 GHVP01069149.1:216-875(-)